MLGRKAYLVIPLLLVLVARIFLSLESQPHYEKGQEISLSGMLSEEPQQYGLNQSFIFQGVSISTVSDTEYHYGDALVIKGTISCSKFDPTICKAQIHSPKITVQQTPTSPFFHLISSFRNFVNGHIRKVLPNDLASLFIGITFGSKENYSQHVKYAFQHTGTLHVIAASGMNITLLIGFLLPLLTKCMNRRKAAFVVILVVILYAILAQLSSSIVRASIMGILVLIGLITGRQTHAGYFLVVAAMGMILVNPQVLFDIGFQLSFLATIGLVYIKPIIDYKFINTQKVKKKWYGSLIEDMSTTLAAQIATLPILLVNFGTFSLISVLVNALVLWTVPMLMVGGFIYAAVSFIPFIPNILLYISYPLLFYFIQVIVLFDKPYFILDIPFFSVWFGIGYYFLLLSLFIYLGRSISFQTSSKNQ